MTRATKLFAIALFGLTGALLAQTAAASTVTLANATADFSQTGFPVAEAIDGIVVFNDGWAISPEEGSPHTAVFQTVSDPSFAPGSEFTFTLSQPNGSLGGEYLGHFRLSVTTGASPTESGSETWIPLAPISATSDSGQTLVINGDNSILLTSTGGTSFGNYTIVADTTVTGITGFRLEALTDPSLPDNGPGRAAGNFVISEFSVTATQLPEPASLSLLAAGSLLALRRNKRQCGV